MSLKPPSDASREPSAPPSPNTLATRLSEYDLPPPSAISGPAPMTDAPGATADNIADRLSKLDLPPPEEVRKAEVTGRARRNTDDVTEEISKMDFPIPESIRLGRHPSLGKKAHNKDAGIPHKSLQVQADRLMPLPDSEAASPAA